MKSLSLSLGLAALALALALVCTPASAEEGRLLSLMPLMPSREEQRALLREARGHGKFAERMRPPVAGLRRKLQMEGALPAAAAAAAATHVAASGHEKIVPKHKGEKHAGEREPQPDFAGRVQVALPRDHTGRIINGQKAVLGQFPWQAGVYMDFGFSGKAWCGGSIIHSEWILTAAHCVDDEPDSYMIVVGSLGSEAGKEPTRQEFKGITETYQHPGYDPYFIDNDIGFVKLSSTNKIKYSAYVMPIRLPSYSMAVDMMVGTVGTVSGWGLIADSASWITDQLMYVSNKIDDGKACYDYYGNAWIPNKICTKTEDIKSICSGDSGGAFTFEEEPGVHTQIGIVSFGARKGCEFGLPTAYTRLASHLDFVEEITNIAIRD